MQVTIEDLSPVEKKLDVEIPWELVEQRLTEAYRTLSRGVQLRGFRRGKVPRPMLERMFGKTVQQEVMSKLVSEGFAQVAHEQNLRPVAEPVVDDAKMPEKPGEPLKFTARVEIRTEVKPQDYKGVELKRRTPAVSDEEVDRALKRKQSELTEYRAIEGRDKTGPSDVLILSLHGMVGKKKVDKDEVRIDLGNPETEPLPGLTAPLLGISIEQKVFKVDFEIPADHPHKELAGQKVALEVTLKDVREKVVPALDDDFAKDTGEADTLAELRDKLRKQLLDGDQTRVQQELRQALVAELLRRNEVAVAPSLVERQLDVAVERAKIQLLMAGVDVKNGLDEERLREDLRASAHEEVRAALLLDTIAEVEGVTVSDAEVDQHVAKVATARQVSPQKLKAEWRKEGRLDGIRHGLREEKTLDLLVSQAKISSEETSAPPNAP